MSLTGLKKHVRVLEDARLVTTEGRRLYVRGPAPWCRALPAAIHIDVSTPTSTRRDLAASILDLLPGTSGKSRT
jgi:hypothetical protein